jgi:hypothetical protein
VTVGRAERWEAIKPKAIEAFGNDEHVLATVAAQIHLLEMAWHGVYGEIAPSESIVEQVLLCSKGTLDGLIRAARLAVLDRRDLQVWAGMLRADRPVL